MKHHTLKILILFHSLLFISCEMVTNHTHDGSYSMNISVYGVNMNSKVDLIINGDEMNLNGNILNIKQYNDRIDFENGKTISIVDGDLIANLPTLGNVRYIRVSSDNNLNQK